MYFILVGLSKVDDLETMKEAAEKLVSMGAKSALVKGGHLGSNADGKL